VSTPSHILDASRPVALPEPPAPVAELSPERLRAYLDRLGVGRVEPPSLPFLTRLQRRHLLRVPFENLDIFWGNPIPLDVQRAWSKVVEQRRGGFCYELNGLFGTALTALGFRVSLLSARVWRKAGRAWGPHYDHLALLVRLEQPYLVDVGFGDSFRSPMPLTSGIRSDVSGAYRLVSGEWADELVLQYSSGHGHWRPLFRVSLEPRPFQAFAEMNLWQQTSPASPFVGRAVFTLARPWGRLTLTDRHAIESRRGRIHRVRLQPGELERRLRRHGVRGPLGPLERTFAA
jgi:N-hydroxyarylamine O-acetyltransferase